MTATLHERVCALMKDGRPRAVTDVVDAVGSTYMVVYKVLAKLETEESLSTIRDPRTGLRLYSWVP